MLGQIAACVRRPGRKKVHVACQVLAASSAALGAVAAFQSHNLKLPSPIPNLYSPHSYLGLLTLILLSLQFTVGFGSYLYPTISLPGRLALGPVHKFFGKAVWVAGLATIAVRSRFVVAAVCGGGFCTRRGWGPATGRARCLAAQRQSCVGPSVLVLLP